MIDTNRYIPPEPGFWQGRMDLPDKACLFQIVKLLDLSVEQTLPLPDRHQGFALIGFCCDEGIRRNQGRTGASEGPKSIREMLGQLPILRSNLHLWDAGNIICPDGDLESSQIALGEAIAFLINHQLIPIVLGGGHELAFGHYLGIKKALPQALLGIVNFDAHFDLRPLLSNGLGSSGSPFLQIANDIKERKQIFNYNCIGIQSLGNINSLFDQAKQLNVRYYSAETMYSKNQEEVLLFLQEGIKNSKHLYVSICLDVFAAAFAPGVSAPQPLGLVPWQVLPLLRTLCHSQKTISYDIAEMCPHYDSDGRTARLAANLISEILHHHRKVD